MRFVANTLLLFCFSLVVTQVYAGTGHDLFDQVLNAHVDNGVVDYPAIKADKRIYDYLDYLAKANPDSFSTNKEKLAFYINAYNAFAIKGIIDGLSPKSFFSKVTYFKTTVYELAGDEVSLDHLEKKIIIPFNEARIHFAIVCASTSCPKLISEAYTADKLEQQLNKNTKTFINNDFKNNFDLSKKRANISKIFDWFTKDFKRDSGSIQKFLAKYAEDKSIADLLRDEKMKVRYVKYDWSLNGKPLE